VGRAADGEASAALAVALAGEARVVLPGVGLVLRCEVSAKSWRPGASAG
jgi:hypothetical protein